MIEIFHDDELFLGLEACLEKVAEVLKEEGSWAFINLLMKEMSVLLCICGVMR